MTEIDFWYSIGSTYSYLSVMRLQQVGRETGMRFRWRPFNVRAIMKEMDNIPFATKPKKAAYMWRDIQRRAMLYDLAPKIPAPYPLAELERANRVAVIGCADGWVADYSRAAYRRWFDEGLPAGSEPNLSASIAEAGADPAAVIARADGAEGVSGLERATDEARGLGIFGSPTFAVGGEIFWGDDRLDDAIRWARSPPAS